jgi:hypothetical protein
MPNADELFQNFLYHTSDTDFNKAKVDTDAAVPITKEEAKKDGQQGEQHLGYRCLQLRRRSDLISVTSLQLSNISAR